MKKTSEKPVIYKEKLRLKMYLVWWLHQVSSVKKKKTVEKPVCWLHWLYQNKTASGGFQCCSILIGSSRKLWRAGPFSGNYCPPDIMRMVDIIKISAVLFVWELRKTTELCFTEKAKGSWALEGWGEGPVQTPGITEPSLEDTNILFMMLYMYYGF